MPEITNEGLRRIMRAWSRLVAFHDELSEPENVQGPPSAQADRLRPIIADLERGVGAQSLLPDEPI